MRIGLDIVYTHTLVQVATGTGGELIWGGEFEDEFHPTLIGFHPEKNFWGRSGHGSFTHHDHIRKHNH